MDLQACIKLVSEHQPGDDSSLLLSAVQQLKAAVRDVGQIGDGLRPLLKALVTASVHVPEQWDDILEVLRIVLANATVPWLHRAFLLKALPGMLTDAPLAQQQHHGEALCEVLVHWSIPPPGTDESSTQDPQEETSHHPNQQERRVALAALLSLPQGCAFTIVERLLAQLPDSLPTCLAVVTSASSSDALKRAFEALICKSSSSSHTSSLAEIEKKLKEYFKGYGSEKCEQLCDALVSRNSVKSTDELRALHDDLRALEGMDATHSSTIAARVSLAFLVARATEVVGLLYTQQQQSDGQPQIMVSQEDSVLPLTVMRSIVQLTHIASVVPDSVSTEEMRKICGCLLLIGSSDAALDAPLPLVECVLHLFLRTLPCMSATDKDLKPLLVELVGITRTLLTVMEDAVRKIQSAAPLLLDKTNSSNAHAKTEVKGDESQNTHPNQTLGQSALKAFRVAYTVAQLCRIYMKKRLIDGAQEGDQWKKMAEETASSAREISPSWSKEKERTLRLDMQITPKPGRITTGVKRELRPAQKPRHGKMGVTHRPFKRHRRGAP